MKRILREDPGFVPCPVADGDELFANGIFEFNITRLLLYIAGNPEDVELVEVSVGDFPTEISSVEERHVKSVDTSRPVVLAEIAPGHFNLIDGNHRMEKARRLGITSIQAYRLSSEQHVRFLTCGKAYKSYIEYWNGKLE